MRSMPRETCCVEELVIQQDVQQTTAHLIPAMQQSLTSGGGQPTKWGSETIILFAALVPVDDADATCIVFILWQIPSLNSSKTANK